MAPTSRFLIEKQDDKVTVKLSGMEAPGTLSARHWGSHPFPSPRKGSAESQPVPALLFFSPGDSGEALTVHWGSVLLCP